MNRLVSILVPVYNREQLIGPCLRSALAQTITDIEVVVVDNASTDGTVGVCQEIASEDPRVRVFVNETNLGPVRNWQRCLQEARGYYAKLLFSDDLLAPAYLEKTLPYLAKDEVGFVFTSAWLGPEPFAGNVFCRFLKASGVYPSDLYTASALFNGDVPVSPGAALFRLSDLRNNLLDTVPSPVISDFPRHGAGPDLLTYLLTAAQYPSVAFIDAPLAYFRAHAESITLSDRENYLSRCYRQARIWFAEKYLQERYFHRLCLYEWKRECSQRHQWQPLEQMLGNYTLGAPNISWLSRCGGLILAKRHKKGRLAVRFSQEKLP